MSLRTAFLVWLLVNTSNLVSAQVAPIHLDLVVEGIKQPQGFISVAVYCDSAQWLSNGGWVAGAKVAASSGSRIRIAGVPRARCAVSLFHDLNSNDELDRRILPTEPYGFSRNPTPKWGPPSFEDCAVDVDKPIELTIKLR